jgi:hypothetical protein
MGMAMVGARGRVKGTVRCCLLQGMVKISRVMGLGLAGVSGRGWGRGWGWGWQQSGWLVGVGGWEQMGLQTGQPADSRRSNFEGINSNTTAVDAIGYV